MAILKFRDNGEWKSIAAFKGEDGKDGAIQYQAGPGINISDDNIISATFSGEDGVDITVDAQPLPESNNPVASGGVYTALQAKADKTDIKTDTSELTNGAGFITSDDIPGDLGDFKNEAGFLTEESDPFFSKSAAAGITAANITEWNRIDDLHICPIHVSGNYSDGSSITITSSSILNQVKKYIDKYGVFGTAIYLITSYRADLYIPVRSAVSGTTTSGYNEWSYKSVKPNSTDSTLRVSSMLVSSRRSDGVYTQITVSTSTTATVTPSSVLSKTNTTAYTPTADYHPATKQYVDNTVSAGLAGVGGITEEEDPTVPVWVKNITEQDIINWNNKADSGGIEQETDPTVPTWVKLITEADIASWNGKANASDIPGIVEGIVDGKGYITEEAAFNNSVAATIKDTDIANWNNKQDRLVFETEYHVETNKAATMADVNTVDGKLTAFKQDVNNRGYITTVWASEVNKDNHTSMSSNQTSLQSLFPKLNTLVMRNGSPVYSNLIGNYSLSHTTGSSYNGISGTYWGDQVGTVQTVRHIQEKALEAIAPIIGTAGSYDTEIHFTPYWGSPQGYASYVQVSYFKFILYVNEEDIINGTSGPYALVREKSTYNFARYS